MAGVLYNRMQNLHMNGNCDNKFYHYCYVCNTQLNSCKQALLHCSGKRHRKKLQFLQTRKSGPFPGVEQGFGPNGGAPSAGMGALAAAAASVSSSPPAGALVTMTGGASAAAPQPPPMTHHVATIPNAAAVAAAAPGCFYPIMTPIEHWLTPPGSHAPHPPPHFVHFHPGGQYGIPTAAGHHLFRPHHHQLPTVHHLTPTAVPLVGPHHIMHQHRGPPMPPRPLLRYHESLATSTGSNSPIMMSTDVSAFGSGSSTGTRSAVISPSETSSISSESLISPKTRLLYRCQVCQRQFVTNTQLQVHLQTSRHYKQYLMGAERAGDSSETDSWVSSGGGSIYYCMVCNIAVNSPAQLEAHTASHKHKSRISLGDGTAAAMAVNGTAVTQRAHSRSSSTSSETPIELIVDSGYVSGSGDELICISHPTPEKPTAKFRCQICDLFLNSPAQAKQHLSSQKHMQRIANMRPPQFRRKSSSIKRKQLIAINGTEQTAAQQNQPSEEGSSETDSSMTEMGMVDQPEDEEDDHEEETPEDLDGGQDPDDQDDKATIVRCHSL